MDTLRDALYRWVNVWRADNSIKLTASWLEYCLKNHGPTCPGLLAPEAPLPTRLLDILPRDGSEVRLIDTSNSPPTDKRYLALSHCWGHYPPLHKIKLQNAKLSVYLQNIPLETLPKTFKDAIRITRELGLRYIWIDSLCIIQDSPEDWEREASLMYTVYKNAYCTVAASASRDGSGGCFVQGPYEPLQAGFEGLFPRADVPRGVMPPPPPVWKKMLESGPLGSRAWCFQERQLSPRVVHFTRHGLVWECCTCIATEDKPQSGLEPIEWCHDRRLDKSFDDGIGYNLHRIFDPSGDPTGMAARGVRRSRTELLYDRWIDGVANYTSREMTRSSDRFPALSGLAQAVIEATGDTYLAGLWHGDLCRGLLWSRAYLDSARENTRHWTRPTESEYRAPSWSWASINGPVNAMHFLRMSQLRHFANLSQLQLLNYSITTTGTNPTGSLSAARLKISGLLKRAISAEPAINLHFWYLSEFDPFHTRSQSGPQCGRISFDISTESFPQPVYCLSVVDYGMVDNTLFCGPNLYIGGRLMPRYTPQNGGLALVPTNEDATEFRRVGIVEWDEGWFDECHPTTIEIV